jgi:hypothetical protein
LLLRRPGLPLAAMHLSSSSSRKVVKRRIMIVERRKGKTFESCKLQKPNENNSLDSVSICLSSWHVNLNSVLFFRRKGPLPRFHSHRKKPPRSTTKSKRVQKRKRSLPNYQAEAAV